MSDHYNEAPRSLRWGRLISKNREMLREIPVGGLESFDSQLDDHLSGRWIRTEVQAVGSFWRFAIIFESGL